MLSMPRGSIARSLQEHSSSGTTALQEHSAEPQRAAQQHCKIIQQSILEQFISTASVPTSCVVL